MAHSSSPGSMFVLGCAVLLDIRRGELSNNGFLPVRGLLSEGSRVDQAKGSIPFNLALGEPKYYKYELRHMRNLTYQENGLNSH